MLLLRGEKHLELDRAARLAIMLGSTKLAKVALQESFANGSLMHLSPTEVKRQLVPEAFAHLE